MNTDELNEKIKNEDMSKYDKEYSETSLFDKIARDGLYPNVDSFKVEFIFDFSSTLINLVFIKHFLIKLLTT